MRFERYAQFTCFTGTKVHILTHTPPANAERMRVFREVRYSICLMYWYKNTNTDAQGRAGARSGRLRVHASACAWRPPERCLRPTVWKEPQLELIALLVYEALSY